MTASIYLIRHGTTMANLENRFAGRTDEPLHAEGVRQISEVGRGLQGLGLAAIYAGPLPRTRQSAEIIAAMCGIAFQVIEELTDINLPHWDGLTKEEIRQRYGPQYPAWKAAPASFAVPGCETLRDVQQRAVAAVEGIRRQHAGAKVLLVTHLIVARCLMLHYSGRQLGHFRSVKVDNGDVVRL
jgi:broad specificity phosphatase PhoE